MTMKLAGTITKPLIANSPKNKDYSIKTIRYLFNNMNEKYIDKNRRRHFYNL